MHWVDYLVCLPFLGVAYLALYSRRYIRGVADYLAAGRVAGRYVICVGDMTANLSVIMLIALIEERYNTGFARVFWSGIAAPVGMAIALSGYCIYRFRETRALSFGQFIEIRYNRALRVFASSLRTLTEMLSNAIGPAVTANFFIYFLGMPHTIDICSGSLPIYPLMAAGILALALLLVLPGGRVSLLITDCIQGLMSYPIFLIITGYVLIYFSWDDEIMPTLVNRVPGESFINPLDMERLRDFNIFATITVIFSQILNCGSWIGNDTTSAGRNAHEQKMAGILGAWRNGFSFVMCTMLAIAVLTVMNHANYQEKSAYIRSEMAEMIAEDIASSPEEAEKIVVAAENASVRLIGGKAEVPLYSNTDNADTPMFDAVHDALGHDAEGNGKFQNFRSIYSQMLSPVVFRTIFPTGLTGLVVLLMILLMVSTDASRVFNAAGTMTQDMILPWLKRPPTPEEHIRLIRYNAVGVAVFFFIISLLFVQLDYINMFLSIINSLWMGGAGPVVVFGLYSRFGTTAGAFASIFAGSGVALAGLLIQRNWAETVYPFLAELGWIEPVGNFLQMVSSPFNPLIVWTMNPVKFPVNSYEISFIAMVAGIIAYVLVSFITCRKPYNLERMLHRGIYRLPGETELVREKWTVSTFFRKVIGITSDYTRGDKIIAYAVFGYSFVYSMVIAFLLVLVWNIISRWDIKYWSWYFFIHNVVVLGIVGIISTVWFSIGGVIDIRRLFRDLANRTANPLDNGIVCGNVSLEDQKNVEAVESKGRSDE